MGRVRALVRHREARRGAGRLDGGAAVLWCGGAVRGAMLRGPREWAAAIAAAVAATAIAATIAAPTVAASAVTTTIATSAVAAAVAATRAVPGQLGSHLHRAWLAV